MKTGFHYLESLLAVLFFIVIALPLHGQTQDEYEIKAAFIYNFAKFVTWQDEPENTGNNFQLCIIGQDPFGSRLDLLEGKEVRGQLLKVRHLSSPEEHTGCHIVFISNSEVEQLDSLIKIFEAEHGTLTVSDINGFTKHGGIIELMLENNKVRFSINTNAAKEAGLEISSKLLQLATRIEGG